MQNRTELINDLKMRIADGRVIVVAGAGVAISAANEPELAGWKGLLTHGIHRCSEIIPQLPGNWVSRALEDLQSSDMDDLLGVAQRVETKLRRAGGEYGRWLLDTVGSMKLQNPDLPRAIGSLNCPIITTNYDSLLSEATGYKNLTWKQASIWGSALQGDRTTVMHLHGHFLDPDSVILGISSYDKILQEQHVQALMRALRTTQSLLFIGFGAGLDDPNFIALRSWAASALSDQYHRHFRLAISSEADALQVQHPALERTFVLPYGDEVSELPQFLKQLAPTDKRSIVIKCDEPATVENGIVSSEIRDSLKAYLESVRDAFGHIRFVEMPFHQNTADMLIDDLFVVPKIAREEVYADTGSHSWPETNNAIEMLEKNGAVVLLGDPGFGKSTLTSFISYQLSLKGANKIKECFGDLIPIPIVLRELELKQDLTWELLLDSFLKHRIGKHLRSRTAIEDLLREGKAFVILDGLDEIGNLTVRRKLRTAVQTAMTTYSKTRWLLTSRVVGYDLVPFHERPGERAKGKLVIKAKKKQRALKRGAGAQIAIPLYLAPFDPEQIREFGKKWYTRNETDPSLVDDSVTQFVTAIEGNEGTQKLARIPYLLTLMALIHRKNTRLPHGRTELYERIATAYLESIDVRRKLNELPYSLAQKMSWLSHIAYHMQLLRSERVRARRGSQGLLAKRPLLEEWLTALLKKSGSSEPRREASDLLDYFAARSGLLLPRGEGKFAFMHLSLQEYFAAYYLRRQLPPTPAACSQ